MANPKEIVVTLKPDGSRVVEANGFRGAACAKATERMIDELGGKTSTKKKKDFNATSSSKEAETQW